MRSILPALGLLVSGVASAQTPRVAVAAGPPPDRRAIWVLQPDHKLARYDAAQFKLWQTVNLPADARQHPESITNSRVGDVLFAYPSDGQTSLRRWWSSNPRHPALVGGAWDVHPASRGGYSILTATPDIYFSKDGEKLYWFEYRQQKLANNGDTSRVARFMAWTTDLDGQNPQAVTEFSSPHASAARHHARKPVPRR